MRCAAVKASGWDPWVLIARPVSFRTVAHQMPWSLTTDGLWGFSRSEWSFIGCPLYAKNRRRSRTWFVVVLRRLLGLRSRTSRGVRFSSVLAYECREAVSGLVVVGVCLIGCPPLVAVVALPFAVEAFGDPEFGIFRLCGCGGLGAHLMFLGARDREPIFVRGFSVVGAVWRRLRISVRWVWVNLSLLPTRRCGQFSLVARVVTWLLEH